MSEDACNGTHGTGQLATVSDITITAACSDDCPSSSRNGGTNIPATSTAKILLRVQLRLL